MKEKRAARRVERGFKGRQSGWFLLLGFWRGSQTWMYIRITPGPFQNPDAQATPQTNQNPWGRAQTHHLCFWKSLEDPVPNQGEKHPKVNSL